jgi:hypothetical protein
MGGALAKRLTYYEDLRAKATDYLFFSWGAPRFAGQRALPSETPFGHGIRFFNDTDVAPLLPFYLNTSLLNIFQSPNTFQRLANYVHGPDGYQLNADGTQTMVSAPRNQLSVSYGALTTLLADLESGSLPGHAPALYDSRMVAWIQSRRSSPLPSDDTSLRLRESAEAATASRQLRQETQRIFTAVQAAQQVQDKQPAAVPRGLRFKAVRWGRMWGVVLGDRCMSYGVRKRAARRLAGELNASFDDILGQAVVNGDNFKAIVADFLAAAADPTSGVSPRINTTLVVN